MNTKKWLTLGLTVALAGCLGWAVAACAPTEPNTPDEGDNPSTPHTHSFTKWDHSDTEHWKVCPEDGEIDVSSRAKHSFDRVTHVCISCGYEEPHTHSYSAWRYDILQHWKVCPGDEAVDPDFPKADHNFVEGKCEDCGRKEPQMYVYGLSTEAFGYSGKWPSISSLGTKKDKWVKMELGDDGKYTADVYFAAGDKFAVGDVASLFRYPAVKDPDSSAGALQIEEANTYTVTFDPADGSVTFAVHAHTYVWKYDADNHWKVCSTKDQAVDESSRGAHVYDQPDNKCVCGAVGTTSCDHSKGYSFNYTELPAASPEGGTLQKTCPDCHDTQDVSYVKGIPHVGGTIGRLAKQTEITDDGNYYLTGCTAFKFHISKAGTYTVRFEGGILKDQPIMRLYMLAFTKGSYLAITGAAASAIYGAQNADKYDEQIAAYGVTIDGYESLSRTTAFKSLSIVIEEDDLTEGDVYVQIGFNGTTESADATNLGYLISVSGFAAAPAAASSAPAEVALVPERKD